MIIVALAKSSRVVHLRVEVRTARGWINIDRHLSTIVPIMIIKRG